MSRRLMLIPIAVDNDEQTSSSPSEQTPRMGEMEGVLNAVDVPTCTGLDWKCSDKYGTTYRICASGYVSFSNPSFGIPFEEGRFETSVKDSTTISDIVLPSMKGRCTFEGLSGWFFVTGKWKCQVTEGTLSRFGEIIVTCS